MSHSMPGLSDDQRRLAADIAERALALPPEQRGTMVRSRSAGDAAVLGEVESLLSAAAGAEADGFLGGPVTAPAGHTGPMTLEQAQEVVGERYRLERLAGEGGMGRVFVASDAVLSRRVAVKLLSGNATGGDGQRDRLLEEARAMAGLSHPNICRVLEVVLAGGSPFIVMEWIDGIDLRQAWRDLSLPQRLSLYLKVVDAAGVGHAVGLVHRDLKPANILIDRRAEPVIVDFGLARADRRDHSGRTLCGGTPGYAAPEQFAQGSDVGPAADVFALGVILYELLTNRPPFRGTTAEETLRAVRGSDPPLPESIAPDTPAALQSICLAALERDPARRYPTAGDLAEDLRRYLRSESVAASPSMLADRFVQQLQGQIENAAKWSRQGLITQTEHRSLIGVLRALMRPESHWIIDSRRLTASQVSLFLGGWLVVVAITIGMYHSWDVLAGVARVGVPWVVTAALLAAGLWLNHKGFRRIALGYFVTTSIVGPLALGLLFRNSGWLTGQDGLGMGTAELFARVRMVDGAWKALEAPVGGLFNAQLACASALWLAANLPLRRLTGSAAFSLLGAFSGIAAWGSLWLLWRGMEAPHDDVTWARAGLWALPLGAAMTTLGMHFNRAEESIAIELGVHRQRRADAWSFLLLGVLLIVGGLSVVAWFHPSWYELPRLFAEGKHSHVGPRAFAFMMNGFLLAALAWVMERHWSLLRERLAVSLRWVIPSHFLGSIFVLEEDNFGEAWGLWLAILPVCAIAFCYLSVLKQWKPFVFNGMVYAALAYAQAFIEINNRFDSRPAWRISLTFGLLAAGLLIMVAAWRVPIWLASARTRRWFSGTTARIIASGAVRRGRPAR
jgi:predicted Ser/Thr protein kinase